MPLTKEKKEELVAQYTEMLQNSRALIVTDYRGLDTSEMTRLRRQVTDADATLLVIKNRLFKLAMENVGLDIPQDFMDGPVAAAFSYGEVPPVAKALSQFADDTEILIVKGGLLDQDFLSSDEIKGLAELPPLEVLQSQLLGLLTSPSSSIAGIMASSVRQVVNVISARVDQGEDEAPAEAVAEAEPADAVEEAEPAEEEEETEAEPAEAEVEEEAPAEESDEGEPAEADAPEADAGDGQ